MSDLTDFFLGESAASFNPKGGAESFEIQDQGQVPTVEASEGGPEPKPPKGTPCADKQGNLTPGGDRRCPYPAKHYCIGHRIKWGEDFPICNGHASLPTRTEHGRNDQYLCSQCSVDDFFPRDERERGRLDKHANLSKFYAGRDDYNTDPSMEKVFGHIRNYKK